MVAASTAHRLGSFVALVALALSGACFDSDQKSSPRSVGTTGEPDDTTTSEGSSSSGSLEATTMEPEFTCRDAVVCIQQCAFDLAFNPSIESDLGCLLDCVEENLTVRETYHLLQLSNCAADECEQTNDCMPEGEGTDTDTGSTGGGDDGGSGIIDPCLQCIFLEMSNPEPTTCVEFHELCNEMPE
ncbi:MAG: hypothetical protein KUG77_21335 [Nannocystaceae bacterium]|nr:hypothetical protein [Nannocystaceae bacterium]